MCKNMGFSLPLTHILPVILINQVRRNHRDRWDCGGNRLGIGGYVFKCPRCGYETEPSPINFTCPRCGSLMEAVLAELPRDVRFRYRRRLGVWSYVQLLPRPRVRVTLNEGGTPLIKIDRGLYGKFEGLNPTGSFKDRGMAVGVSLAKSMGVHSVVVASTGNTAASASAYGARAGLRPIVLLPNGKVARGKLIQSIVHGASIMGVEGYFDDALTEALEMFKSGKAYSLNSINVWRLEGQKSIAYEIYEEVKVPDNVIVPVGNAGNIYAIWKGFWELMQAGLIDKLPRMIGVQAEGAAPLYETWRRGVDSLIEVNAPRTIASAIRIGKPVNWLKAIKAVKTTNGLIVTVSDGDIMRARDRLARRGVFVEPASASTYAAYLKLLREGVVDSGELTILVLTGHGLKDPDSVKG